MCLSQVWGKKAQKRKKTGVVETHDLPTPAVLQKETFMVQTHDLPFFLQKKEVDHTLGPLDGLNT